jgi:hypothetical protein
MRGDMKFVGLFSIIYGALTSLSIVGAIVGIPMIIAGLRLRESADGYEAFARGDGSALTRAFEKQRSYFFIQKILIIVAIAGIVLYIAGIILFVVILGSSGGFESAGY